MEGLNQTCFSQKKNIVFLLSFALAYKDLTCAQGVFNKSSYWYKHFSDEGNSLYYLPYFGLPISVTWPVYRNINDEVFLGQFIETSTMKSSLASL